MGIFTALSRQHHSQSASEIDLRKHSAPEQHSDSSQGTTASVVSAMRGVGKKKKKKVKKYSIRFSTKNVVQTFVPVTPLTSRSTDTSRSLDDLTPSQKAVWAAAGWTPFGNSALLDSEDAGSGLFGTLKVGVEDSPENNEESDAEHSCTTSDDGTSSGDRSRSTNRVDNDSGEEDPGLTGGVAEWTGPGEEVEVEMEVRQDSSLDEAGYDGSGDTRDDTTLDERSTEGGSTSDRRLPGLPDGHLTDPQRLEATDVNERPSQRLDEGAVDHDGSLELGSGPEPGHMLDRPRPDTAEGLSEEGGLMNRPLSALEDEARLDYRLDWDGRGASNLERHDDDASFDHLRHMPENLSVDLGPPRGGPSHLGSNTSRPGFLASTSDTENPPPDGSYSDLLRFTTDTEADALHLADLCRSAVAEIRVWTEEMRQWSDEEVRAISQEGHRDLQRLESLVSRVKRMAGRDGEAA